jgi:hypothetical protein
MNIPSDAISHIEKTFSDPKRIIGILLKLKVEYETDRIIRCILIMSDSDRSSVEAWVREANKDVSRIIRYAEYDNREVRKFNFNLPMDQQIPYSYD